MFIVRDDLFRLRWRPDIRSTGAIGTTLVRGGTVTLETLPDSGHIRGLSQYRVTQNHHKMCPKGSNVWKPTVASVICKNGQHSHRCLFENPTFTGVICLKIQHSQAFSVWKSNIHRGYLFENPKSNIHRRYLFEDPTFTNVACLKRQS